VTLVLLHGFLGLPESWGDVVGSLGTRERVLRPALLGHGAADWDALAMPVDFQGEVDRLAARLRDERVSSVHVVGYSMGARVALVLAARHRALVQRLTLVSGSAGLDDEGERRERAASDDRLADELRSLGLPSFVRKWEALPLFATQQRLSAGARARHRARRLAHRERFVARALETLSPGRMPVMSDRLGQIEIPVSLVAGSLDTKFAGIARSIAPLFPRAHVHIIDGAGHDPCLERPRELAALISETALTENAP
jgi:2-succinyl-6-hydroxy-2,4-cyclohexadiene-1-carboxylate synthase